MNRSTLLLAGLLSLAGIAAHAESPDPSGQFAAHVSSGKTRVQVRAELQDAQRSGDILAAGDTGLTEYQLNPGAFPAHAVVAGKTREQVRAETLQAVRDGEIIAAGELGLTGRQAFPQSHAARSAAVPVRHTAGVQLPALQP